MTDLERRLVMSLLALWFQKRGTAANEDANCRISNYPFGSGNPGNS